MVVLNLCSAAERPDDDSVGGSRTVVRMLGCGESVCFDKKIPALLLSSHVTLVKRVASLKLSFFICNMELIKDRPHEVALRIK